MSGTSAKAPEGADDLGGYSVPRRMVLSGAAVAQLSVQADTTPDDNLRIMIIRTKWLHPAAAA